MIRRLLPLLFALPSLFGSAPVFADQVSEFAAACARAGGSADVCACKAKAAGELLDERLMGLVILSMRDPDGFAALSRRGEITHSDNAAWTAYIRDCNRACNLNY